MAHQSREEAQEKRAAEWNLNLATALFLRLEKRGQSAIRSYREGGLKVKGSVLNIDTAMKSALAGEADVR